MLTAVPTLAPGSTCSACILRCKRFFLSILATRLLRSPLRWLQSVTHVGAASAGGAEPLPPQTIHGVRPPQCAQESISLAAALFQTASPVLLLLLRQTHPGEPAFDPAVDEYLQGAL